MLSEKIALGNMMSRTLLGGAANQVSFVILGTVATALASTAALVYTRAYCLAPAPVAVFVLLYKVYIFGLPACNTTAHLVLKSVEARKYSHRKIPSATLVELYMAEELDFKGGDVMAGMRAADEYVDYRVTWSQARYLLLQLFPNSQNFTARDKKNSLKEIADHYDMGNEFFAAFLGPRMKYTSAIYPDTACTLEAAQDHCMRRIHEKVRAKPGHRVLDIGCGWGTLAGHAARELGAESVGVTLSAEGAKWCRENNPEASFLLCDYRDIPADTPKFDAITCIEMAEHVGLQNFQQYLGKVADLLTDEGAFLMQVAGFRRGADYKDLAWALFMGRYIFPGANASTPLYWYIEQLEQAGFEVESVENIGPHYSLTLNQWYSNWCKNAPTLAAVYPTSLTNLWSVFLAWSTLASKRGSATCYQIVAHKGACAYDKFQRAEMMRTVGPVGGIEELQNPDVMWGFPPNGNAPSGAGGDGNGKKTR
jgi:cyclopropane fatty-acyl-phospholipid synthase-like methyltransferase